MAEPNDARGPGRPRSERSRRAVLTAALELLSDRGLPGLSVDEIAARAGVGKNTIYRWWPTKGAVLMDAFTEAYAGRMEAPEEGDARTRLRVQARRVAELMNTPEARRPFVALVAAAQHDPELAAALRERFLEPRRAGVEHLLATGIAEGEFRPDLDPALVIDLLYGALYYRLLVSGAHLDPAYADHLVDILSPVLRA
ncbi:TetR/AcrR family transcriptional regulator [Nocardia blacklockiae]|uniref:TetR/AcrR family transcriptional regulator n=1 Tax=Nocardia blacklockiae TaxID=480036 RepID=UPI0018948248|nr:TetR/AcrR family transcriptional regulator [Nocardia blacklockiae]MBF6170842.1 TetR/AcrR family transcriptional regulator [Nocardia blacklockiae]